MNSLIHHWPLAASPGNGFSSYLQYLAPYLSGGNPIRVNIDVEQPTLQILAFCIREWPNAIILGASRREGKEHASGRSCRSRAVNVGRNLCACQRVVADGKAKHIGRLVED